MKVIVAGGDGFIGWPLFMALSHAGYEVLIVDNYTRRALVKEVGSESLVPIVELQERLRVWPSAAPHAKAIAGEE
jgi:UDP-sulfoquinovose synthase